jgi:hypothetical protein
MGSNDVRDMSEDVEEDSSSSEEPSGSEEEVSIDGFLEQGHIEAYKNLLRHIHNASNRNIRWYICFVHHQLLKKTT